jgi:hypothetical protein
MTGADIVESVKNTAVVLTSLAGAAYGCGYLVVRARARALGADPGFALVDQAYVFAGFRFVLVLLLSLLISVPVLLILRWSASRALALGAGPFLAIETGGALIAAALTIWAYSATTRVNGVLLSGSSDWIAAAVLGRNSYGVLLCLATTVGAAALLVWTAEHYLRAEALDPLGAVLALITGLLIALLPVQHGVFHAERTVRKLDGVPQAASSLAPPVWVVDRAADRVTLFGRGADGHARLVTLKAEQLDGVPVVGVGVLHDVLGDPNP